MIPEKQCPACVARDSKGNGKADGFLRVEYGVAKCRHPRCDYAEAA